MTSLSAAIDVVMLYAAQADDRPTVQAAAGACMVLGRADKGVRYAAATVTQGINIHFEDGSTVRVESDGLVVED